MNFNRVMGLIFVAAGAAFGLATALRGQTQSGDWTIRKSDEPGKVEVSIMDARGGHHFHSSSDWEVKELTGLDLSKPGRQDVHFTITRDAGKFECEGYVKDGEGAGFFHFIPDTKYAQEMKALGFGGIDGDKQWAMAIHDVSLKFAREIKAKNLQGLDTDKLIAFKIHGVTPEFIDQMRSSGVNLSDSDKFIAFRIHGVSPQFVSDLRSAGLTVTDSDKLIAFRIHGVSPEMVRSVRQAGYDAEPDKLVAMRIHGVTPEFISKLQSRGMKDLSIDKLVSLRIHGID